VPASSALRITALSAAFAGSVLMAAIAGAAAQARSHVPSPSQVKPIVPVPPGNPGRYNGGVIYSLPGAAVRCPRSCVKTQRPSRGAPPHCVKWRAAC
jgi:hypothetical protein